LGITSAELVATLEVQADHDQTKEDGGKADSHEMILEFYVHDALNSSYRSRFLKPKGWKNNEAFWSDGPRVFAPRTLG